jgi:hypothetical protein
MSTEGLRAQAQRALQKVSQGEKPLGTAFPVDFQGLSPTVPPSRPLGRGQRDTPGSPLSGQRDTPGSPLSGKSGTVSGTPVGQWDTPVPKGYGSVFSALKSRCPDHVPVARWRATVEDGRAFLSRWGEQAEALGWTSRDLFGLHTVPDNPHPSYRRLSRYDATGLIWLLQGRPVVALTEATAAIENPKTGNVTTYRRFNRPALGPLGDSLDDLDPPFGGAPHDRR